MGKHLSSKTSNCIKTNLISDSDKLATNMERQLPQQTSHIIKPNLNDDKSAPTNMERQLSSEIDNCKKSDQDDEKSSTTVKKLKKLKKPKVKKQGPDLRQVSNVDQHQTESSFDGKPDSKYQNCTTSEPDSKDQNCSLKTTSKTDSNENSSSGEKICLWMDQKGQVIININL